MIEPTIAIDQEDEAGRDPSTAARRRACRARAAAAAGCRRPLRVIDRLLMPAHLRTSDGRPRRCTRSAAGSSGHPEIAARFAEGIDQERARVIERFERPPAVQDADPEAIAEERAIAAAPRAVFGAGHRAARRRRRGRSRGPRAGDRRDAAPVRPRRSAPAVSPRKADQKDDDDVGRGIGRVERRRSARRSTSVTRAPRSVSCRARIPSGVSTSMTSRPPTGPSASSARGILPSTSRTRASVLTAGAPARWVDLPQARSIEGVASVLGPRLIRATKRRTRPVRGGTADARRVPSITSTESRSLAPATPSSGDRSRRPPQPRPRRPRRA